MQEISSDISTLYISTEYSPPKKILEMKIRVDFEMTENKRTWRTQWYVGSAVLPPSLVCQLIPVGILFAKSKWRWIHYWLTIWILQLYKELQDFLFHNIIFQSFYKWGGQMPRRVSHSNFRSHQMNSMKKEKKKRKKK